MPSWSSGHSVQAFGTSSESLTSESYHWPQLEGHRGPMWNVPLVWGVGEDAQGPAGRPTLSPPTGQPRAGAGAGACTHSTWSSGSCQAQSGGGVKLGTWLRAQVPTLCLQIDQPTLGMPSREYYFKEGNNQKVSQGLPDARSAPYPQHFLACPFCSGCPLHVA